MSLLCRPLTIGVQKNLDQQKADGTLVFMHQTKSRESKYPAILNGKSKNRYAFINAAGAWVNRPVNSTMSPTPFTPNMQVVMPDRRRVEAMVISTAGTELANETWCSFAVALVDGMIIQCLVDKRHLDGEPTFRLNQFSRWQGRGNEFKGMPI